MTVEECYIRLGADYGDAIRRLGNAERLKKFLGKLASDESFPTLREALAARNYEQAFQAVHTLKGISMNLGLSPLAVSSSALTEVLRGKKADDRIEPLFQNVEKDYDDTIAAIQALLDE